VRGTKVDPVKGEHLLYLFLTSEPNGVVGPGYPKAMPVILTTPEKYETWLTAPTEVALKLQRPLPDDILEIVAEGAKANQPAASPIPCLGRLMSRGAVYHGAGISVIEPQDLPLPYPQTRQLLSPLREVLRSLFECDDTHLKSTDFSQRVCQVTGRQPHGNNRGDQGANLDGFALVMRPMQSLF
jgi:hypothetical protein